MSYSFKLELDSVEVFASRRASIENDIPLQFWRTVTSRKGVRTIGFLEAGDHTIDSGNVTFCKDIDSCMIIFLGIPPV
jgi:hypothetical protein